EHRFRGLNATGRRGPSQTERLLVRPASAGRSCAGASDFFAGGEPAGSGRRYGLALGAFATDVVDLVAHHPPPQHQGEATEDPPFGCVSEVTDVQPRVLGDRWAQMLRLGQGAEGTGGLLCLRSQLPGVHRATPDVLQLCWADRAPEGHGLALCIRT